MDIFSFLLVCTTFIHDTWMNLVELLPEFDISLIRTIGTSPATPLVAITQPPPRVHFATYTSASAFSSTVPTGNFTLEYLPRNVNNVCVDFNELPLEMPIPAGVEAVNDLKAILLLCLVLLGLFLASLICIHRRYLLAVLSLVFKLIHGRFTNELRDLGIVHAGIEFSFLYCVEVTAYDSGRMTWTQAESVELDALWDYLVELKNDQEALERSYNEMFDTLATRNAELKAEIDKGIKYPSLKVISTAQEKEKILLFDKQQQQVDVLTAENENLTERNKHAASLFREQGLKLSRTRKARSAVLRQAGGMQRRIRRLSKQLSIAQQERKSLPEQTAAIQPQLDGTASTISRGTDPFELSTSVSVSPEEPAPQRYDEQLPIEDPVPGKDVEQLPQASSMYPETQGSQEHGETRSRSPEMIGPQRCDGKQPPAYDTVSVVENMQDQGKSESESPEGNAHLKFSGFEEQAWPEFCENDLISPDWFESRDEQHELVDITNAAAMGNYMEVDDSPSMPHSEDHHITTTESSMSVDSAPPVISCGDDSDMQDAALALYAPTNTRKCGVCGESESTLCSKSACQESTGSLSRVLDTQSSRAETFVTSFDQQGTAGPAFGEFILQGELQLDQPDQTQNNNSSSEMDYYTEDPSQDDAGEAVTEAMDLTADVAAEGPNQMPSPESASPTVSSLHKSSEPQPLRQADTTDLQPQTRTAQSSARQQFQLPFSSATFGLSLGGSEKGSQTATLPQLPAPDNNWSGLQAAYNFVKFASSLSRELGLTASPADTQNAGNGSSTKRSCQRCDINTVSGSQNFCRVCRKRNADGGSGHGPPTGSLSTQTGHVQSGTGITSSQPPNQSAHKTPPPSTTGTAKKGQGSEAEPSGDRAASPIFSVWDKFNGWQEMQQQGSDSLMLCDICVEWKPAVRNGVCDECNDLFESL